MRPALGLGPLVRVPQRHVLQAFFEHLGPEAIRMAAHAERRCQSSMGQARKGWPCGKIDGGPLVMG